MNGFQKKIVIHALEYEENLSEWESEFINDIAKRNDDYEISDKQNSILNRISEKIGNI